MSVGVAVWFVWDVGAVAHALYFMFASGPKRSWCDVGRDVVFSLGWPLWWFFYLWNRA